MKLRKQLTVATLTALQLTLGQAGMANAQAIAPLEVRALDRGSDGAIKVFEPAVIQIQPGETVDFVAWDFGHDLIAVDGLLPIGAPGFKGYKNADTSVSFDSEGFYVYQCAAHKAVGMVGLVVVGNPDVNLDAVLASYRGNAALSGPAIEQVGVLLASLVDVDQAKVDQDETHSFMTFNGQVPAPMIRARQGDTLNITVTNPAESESSHSIDLHVVYGTGGGGAFTEVAPGQSKSFSFKALYPGAFIYHCGVSNMDEHISRGMFGMIVIEPEEGLPKVDREFYIGQHELYTKEGFGQPGEATFNGRDMAAENPTYVMFNGAVAPFVASRFGTMKAEVGETVRVFLVSGGPNKTSSFHPVGNIWSRAWPQGGLANPPLEYIQTWPVSPGSAFVGDMKLPVPGLVTLVDHALSRVTSKGNAAQIEVIGAEQPEILDTGK